MAENFSILRAPASEVLEQRLSAAIAQNPRLAAERDNVMRPVALLEAMAGDALAALGDGALDADRLRVLLYLAWPYGALVEEANDLTAQDTSRAYYEPGVLDHGSLVLLALAAIHTAPSAATAAICLRAVHGLALAASAAEVIGRLDPKMPEAGAMGAVLQTLYLLEAVSDATKASILRQFSIDPVERARWRCLASLFDPERSPWARAEIASHGGWPGGYSQPIIEVSPNHAEPGDVVTLIMDGGELGAGDHVVFAAPDRPPIEAEFFNQRRDDDLGPRLVDVRVPEGVSPGWVGVSNDERIQRSNAHRRALQKGLPAGLAGHACLRESPIPASRIPLLGALAVPPRTGLNRFYGGKPILAGRARVVLLRAAVVLEDAFIPPVNGEAARRAVTEAFAARNIDASIYEPPWVTDDLAAIAWEPEGDTDPGLITLLDALAAAALATPGLEDAMWLLLIPRTGQRHPVQRTLSASMTAEAARAVAVADLRGLSRLVSTFDPAEPLAQPSRLLRVVVSGDGDAITLARVEEETRPRGRGAPVETPYLVVTLDRAGSALQTTPLRGSTRDAPSFLGALVPVSPRVSAIEIRRDGEAIARAARPSGELTIIAGGLDPETGVVTWDYEQSRGARAQATIALRFGDIDTRAFDLDACTGDPVIPLHRFGRTDALVIQATDGWNSAREEIASSALAGEDPVVIRRIGERRYWADAPEGWSVVWSLNGKALSAEVPRVVTLGARDEGLLRIEASNSDVTIADTRRVGRGR